VSAEVQLADLSPSKDDSRPEFIGWHFSGGTEGKMKHARLAGTASPLILQSVRKACIRSTRVMVSVILDNVAAGVPHAEIVSSYPPVQESDIQAALAYAAVLAREGTLDLPLEHTI
jgi:uncharacterized protein (DUF433 family)